MPVRRPKPVRTSQQRGAAMRMTYFVGLASLLLLASSATPTSAQVDKVAVYVQFSGDDAVGKQLAFLFKERIRSSGSFQEVLDELDAALVTPIVSLDPDHNGRRTIYSFTVLIENRSGLNYHV